MPGLGSWARFVVGILLAGEVIRDWIFGNSVSVYAIGLAALMLGLVVAYFVFRI